MADQNGSMDASDNRVLNAAKESERCDKVIWRGQPIGVPIAREGKKLSPDYS